MKTPPAVGGGSAAIRFENEGHYAGLELVGLRRWLDSLVREVVPSAATFAICLTSDRRIRRMNRDFRDVDQVTDVLSFPGEETPEGFHLGDLVVSIPTARRQARSLGHSLQRELRELILHGVLHCLGMNHESDQGEMDRRELDLRSRWIGEEVS